MTEQIIRYGMLQARTDVEQYSLTEIAVAALS